MPSAIPRPTRPTGATFFGTEDPDWRIRGKDILYAYRTFTRIVRRLDPDRRMLLSGNAILRETQYNQLYPTVQDGGSTTTNNTARSAAY